MQLILLGADVGSVHLYEAGLDGFSITDGQTTDIEELEDHKIVSVFPNPFSDQINIYSEEHLEFDYRLFDVLGKEVLRGKNPGGMFALETTRLRDGFYFLSIIRNGTVRQIEKIMKS